MPAISSDDSQKLLAVSWPSPDDFAIIFRAVHFVATRKERTTRNQSSADVANENGVESRGAISEITNLVGKGSSLPTPSSSPQENEKIASAELAEKTSISQNLEDKSSMTPFQRFRGRYLIVTDFTSQLWCEQQLHYNFDPPPGVVIKEKPQMAKGTDLHLARELEIQEIVEVDITSREDAFALKLLNLMSCIQDFLTGEHLVRREIPIFGAPFNLELFVVGVIDEVRVDSVSGKIDVVELKTRLTQRLPSRSQKKTHSLQVMLYRRMWNDLVSGQLTKADIVKYMKLTPDVTLGEGISEQLRILRLFQKSALISMDALLDRFLLEMTSLPAADQLYVEYCHQETRECFAVDTVPYDETWLRRQLEDSSSYWRGDRSPRGVDIEEAWKCKFCDFADVCAWRIKKQEECAERNRENFSGVASVLPPSMDK